MTLIVHHLGVSQSDRIVWLCEELGIDYELKKYDRSPYLAPAEYSALHPLGAAPVIEDGNVKLAESGACVEYIAQTHGKGRFIIAPGQKNYADYLYWFRESSSSYLLLPDYGLSTNARIHRLCQCQLPISFDERFSRQGHRGRQQ